MKAIVKIYEFKYTPTKPPVIPVGEVFQALGISTPRTEEKIRAIKTLRDQHPIGLKEAKDIVETVMEALARDPSCFFRNEVVREIQFDKE